MWQAGEVIVRREVLNDGWAWLEIPVVVVRDDDGAARDLHPDRRAVHVPAGAGRRAGGIRGHGSERWQGHGVLMLQRPGDAYAVWVFWHGAEREFRSWYLNLQEPFRRTATGYDTQDLELDI